MKYSNRVVVRGWRLLYGLLLRQASSRILKGRLLDLEAPKKGRWLRSDVKEYLAQTWTRVDSLIPRARLDALPSYGNRHNVFLAVITTAAYQIMLERGVSPEYARILVGDLGWKIYSWMLTTVSLPFRVTTRDPGKRMDRTLRTLMTFPFNAPGAPGYEVEVRTEGDRTYTHWTHCPPEAFVRQLSKDNGDRGELEAFYQSWCLYDWPGADILANDGRHGHYSRQQTLSRGDTVCDMCWHGCAQEQRQAGQEVTQKTPVKEMRPI